MALGVAAVYLVRGVGFVLDDWFYLRNVHLDGVLHAAGRTGGDRPAGALAYILLFGMVGPHPAVLTVLLAVGNGGCAILMRRLLVRRLDGTPVFLAAILWLVLPLRTSLEIWFSTGTAVLAALLALAGLHAIEGRPSSTSRVVVGALCIVLATLSYEAVGVLAVFAAGMLAWPWGRVAIAPLAAIAAATGVALLWAFGHRLPGRTGPGGLADPTDALRANFGIGIAGNELLGSVMIIAAIGGSLAVVILGHQLRSMVLVGWSVVAVGVLPFLSYHYSPFGAGDRLNMLSAYGAALVWAGLIAAAWRWHGLVGAACLSMILCVGVAARLERTRVWSMAGRDAVRIAASLPEGSVSPPARIVLGPAPLVEWGIAGLADDSNVNGAVQYRYGTRSVTGEFADGPREFDEARRLGHVVVDVRPLSDLDDASG